MLKAFFIPLLFLATEATASSYSQCEVLGVVEDVYFNKIHLGVLKHEDYTENNLDYNFQACEDLVGMVVALYDDPKDAADEPCTLKVQTGFEKNKFRHKMKDNFQKGDMLKFDYTFYSSKTPTGVVCVKDWRLIEHVPLNPHSK